MVSCTMTKKTKTLQENFRQNLRDLISMWKTLPMLLKIPTPHPNTEPHLKR